MDNLLKGKRAEEKAKDYLCTQGMSYITGNYRSRFGEIDIIMLDNNFIVFVEVRTRTNYKFGGAISSVTKTKQRKIIQTARQYLAQTHKFHCYHARFDVVAIEGEAAHSNIIWIPNAFYSNDW